MKYNLTDLAQACHLAGFPTAHRGLPADYLMAILEGEANPPADHPVSRLTRHRWGMLAIAKSHKEHIRQQIGCNADCANCPDVIVAECAVDNWELTK
jgi:hypothetical protein